MRRLLSITTIAALLSSMLSPLMAAACTTGTGKAVSCHAVEATSCDRPMHQHHHHHAAPQESKSTLSDASVAQNDSKCPMDCCIPGHLRNGAAVSANSFLPPLAVSDQDLHFAPVIFTHAGFSSHTDRGPPLA